MGLLDILRYSIDSLLWGVLIAVGCMALFVFLIKGWYKDAEFSPVSYLVGGILFCLLTVQCILIVGSCKIIQTAGYYEIQLTRMVEQSLSPYEEVSPLLADDIIKQLIEEYPLLEHYISGGEFSGYIARELPHAISEELRSFMQWYIFRRILWCLAFVIVGAVCVIRTMSRRYVRESPRTRPRYKRAGRARR